MSAPLSLARYSPAPLVSLRFLRAYVTTMRPYLLFVSGITGAVGMALVRDVPAAGALVTGAAFFFSYGFGQALTDCFQMDTDAISAPWRPLVRSRVRRSHVLTVSLAGLLATGATLTAANGWNLPLVVAMIAGLATYTRFKRIWWAGPPWNAWIVALVCVAGILSGIGLAPDGAPGDGSARIDDVAVAGTLIAVFFGYMNFVLAGYFKDVGADRETGYRTMPVRLGRHVSVSVSGCLAILAVLGAMVAFGSAPSPESVPRGAAATILLLAGAACSFVAQLRLQDVRRDDEAYGAVVPVVHSYVLVLAAIAAAHRPDWTAFLVSFVTVYFIAIARRPDRSQV